MIKAYLLYLSAAGILLLLTPVENAETILYQEIAAEIEKKAETLFQHPLLDFINDNSIPARRRISFAPYLSFLAMSFADVLDSWILFPNPQNELEKRINRHIEEDDFHYNFFLHDIEGVLGLSLDDFGSYSAVMRHLWGDDSRAIRQYIYGWLDCVARYNDPIITLTSLDAMEAGAQALIGTTSKLVKQEESELKELIYLGHEHVDLEKNHSQFVWYGEEDTVRPLGHIEITREQKNHALEITEEMFER